MQYQLSRVVIGPALHLLGRPRVTSGLENVPVSGPAILASNHVSVIDSLYLPLVIPRPVVFPAKAEYFSAKGPVGRIWAAYLRSTQPAGDEPGATRGRPRPPWRPRRISSAGAICSGSTRKAPGRPTAGSTGGRAGLGWLVLNTGAPVLPVAMVGTRKMMPPGAPLPRPTRVDIRIGKPLEFAHLTGEPPARARRTIADEVMGAIADMSGQQYVHEYASDVKARLTES